MIKLFPFKKFDFEFEYKRRNDLFYVATTETTLHLSLTELLF